MSRVFLLLRKRARKYRAALVAAMCVVVFATTYALILPAITMSQDEASDQPGVELETASGGGTLDAEVSSELASVEESTEAKQGSSESTAAEGTSDSSSAEASAAENPAFISTPTVISSKGDDYSVTAKVDADAQLPTDVKLKAKELSESKDAEAFDRYSKRALKALKHEDDKVDALSELRLFDISFTDEDGAEVEPKAAVQVTLAYGDSAPAVKDSANVKVVHFADDGAVEVVDEQKTAVTAKDGKLERVKFEAANFSVYAITETSEAGVPSGEGKTYRRTYKFQNDDGSDYEFKLTANPGDESSSGSAKTVSQQVVKSDGSLQDVGTPEPQLDANKGHAFLGWGVVSDGTVGEPQQLADISPGTLDADDTVTLRAVFSQKVRITFHDKNDAIVQTKEADKDESVDISDVTTEGTGDVVLVGWAASTDASEPTYTESVSTSSDLDLYPVFKKAKWIDYDINDGEDGNATYVAPSRYAVGEKTVKPDDPTWTGYSFGGWYTDQACTEGNEFEFGDTLDDVLNDDTSRMTLYAKWVPDEASYTVIVWRQRSTDDKGLDESEKSYDFADSFTISGHKTGDTIAADDEALDTYKEYVDGEYKGFSYASTSPSSITVKGDNSGVINVYYDRQLITMKFSTGDWSYEETYSSQDDESEQYGYVDDEYVKLTWRESTNNPGNYYWWYTSNGYYHRYSDTRYTRTYVITQTTTYEGLYGQSLSMYGYSWPSGTWEYEKPAENDTANMSYLGQFVLPDNARTQEEIDANQVATSITFTPVGETKKTVYYYLQNADGTWPTTYSDVGYLSTSNGNWNFSEKFDDYSISAYQFGNDGTESESDDDSDWKPVSSGTRVYWSINGTTDDEGNVEHPALGSTLGLRYSRKSSNVEFFNNGTHLENEDVSKRYGSSLDELVTPDESSLTPPSTETNRYEFLGWFADPEATTYVNFGSDSISSEQQAKLSQYHITSTVNYATMPGHNLPVYAGWKEKRFAVKLDVNGGTLPTGQSTSFHVNYEEKIGANLDDPAQVTREGYELAGWYVADADGKATDTKWDFGTGVTSDLTLVAQWRSTDTIKLAYDLTDTALGVTGTDAPSDSTSYLDGSTAVAAAAPTPPEGYEFVGWSLGGTTHKPGASFEVEEDDAVKDAEGNSYTLTLTAVYTKLGTTYVRYEANGGTGTLTDLGSGVTDNVQRDIEPNATTTLSSGEGFTRDGYVLVGWNTDASADGTDDYASTRYALGDSYGIDGESGNVLYAEWQQVTAPANYLTVETSFVGIDADQIPSAYTASVGSHTLSKNDSGNHWGQSSDKLTWSWKIDNADATTYRVSQSNHEVSGYTVTTTPSLPDTSYEVTAANVTFGSESRITTNRDTTVQVGDTTIFIAALTGNSGCVVITKDPLNASTRKAISDHIPSIGNGNFKNNNVAFYDTTMGGSFTTLAGDVSVTSSGDINTVTFAGKNVWTQAITTTASELPTARLLADIKITNVYTRQVSISKVDESGNALAGASFTLKQGSETVSGGEFTSGASAQSFQLQNGTYELDETAAPAGYVVTNGSVRFTVSSSGVALVDASGNAATYTGVSVSDDGDVPTITITNSPGSALPSTGDEGPGMCVAIGVALIILGSAGGFVLRRRRRGEEGC